MVWLVLCKCDAEDGKQRDRQGLDRGEGRVKAVSQLSASVEP
jgi:hypothetical protein